MMKFLVIICVLINVVLLKNHQKQNILKTSYNQDVNKRKQNFIKPTKMKGINNEILVKTLIDNLTKNLNNQTLIDKIKNSNNENNEVLVNNLTNNLASRNPEMNKYLDEILKNYLEKINQETIYEKIDLMDILHQFNSIINRSNLTNDFVLVNKKKQKDFSLKVENKTEIFNHKNTTDSNKLSRMEFLTDTIISLLIGKLIGLKLGFFAGKLINSVPFNLKKTCCNTNTWPSELPGEGGDLPPTEPTGGQFIKRKSKDKKPSKKIVNKKNGLESKPINDYWVDNEDQEWSTIFEENLNKKKQDEEKNKEDDQLDNFDETKDINDYNDNKNEENEFNFNKNEDEDFNNEKTEETFTTVKNILTTAYYDINYENFDKIKDPQESFKSAFEKTGHNLNNNKRIFINNKQDENSFDKKTFYNQVNPIYTSSNKQDTQNNFFNNQLPVIPNITSMLLNNHIENKKKKYMLLTGK